jgi:hypothetical protein
MPRIFLISMDNDVGRKRRTCFQRSKLIYHHIKGLQYNDITDNTLCLKADGGRFYIPPRGMQNQESARKSAANLASHLKTLQVIQSMLTDHDAIVLEDDSFPKPNLFAVEWTKLPQGSITLLNAAVRHPKNWKHGNRKQRDEVVATFSEGINEINYNIMTWWNSGAYYIPNKEIANKMYSLILERDHIMHVDGMMSYQFSKTIYHHAQAGKDSFDNVLVCYLLYPSVFLNNDHGISEIGHNTFGVIDNYNHL